MATLKDLSRELGLSVTQVSRALNGHSDVSLDTRRRVQDAAKALNYSPNISARKLVSGRSGMVGLVYRTHEGIETDRNFVETVTGLSKEFSRRGMQFVLHIMNEEDDVLDVYAKLTGNGSLDGFVVMIPEKADKRVDFLKRMGVPHVVHGRTTGPEDYPFFDIDNQEVGRVLTQHLIDHGHRRIAFINGEVHRTYSTNRVDGYSAALADAGIELDPELICHGRMTESLGLISTIRMFENPAKAPTAILASNILIAKGIYDALGAMGLRVPEDVSVVAHDDDLSKYSAETFLPPLTVTWSPLKESWAPLAEYLSGAILGKPMEDLQNIAKPEFLQRASVARL